MSEKKYVLVDGDCAECCFEYGSCIDHRPKPCGMKCFKLNPAYKPPSQRVRELIKCQFGYTLSLQAIRDRIERLASELEKDEANER